MECSFWKAHLFLRRQHKRVWYMCTGTYLYNLLQNLQRYWVESSGSAFHKVNTGFHKKPISMQRRTTYNLALSVMISRKTLYQMIAPIFLFPHKMQMCNNMEFIGFQYDFKIITSHLLPLQLVQFISLKMYQKILPTLYIVCFWNILYRNLKLLLKLSL